MIGSVPLEFTSEFAHLCIFVDDHVLDLGDIKSGSDDDYAGSDVVTLVMALKCGDRDHDGIDQAKGAISGSGVVSTNEGPPL